MSRRLKLFAIYAPAIVLVGMALGVELGIPKYSGAALFILAAAVLIHIEAVRERF